MAKVTAPILSFGASGQIAKTQVYASWKGRPYARRFVTPANPNTADQQLTRNAFTWLQQVYKFMPSLATAPWIVYATGKVMTPRNAFSKFNLSNLRGDTDLAQLVLSPGALGGIPAATTTFTPAAGQVTIAATAPADIPSGWTLEAMVGAVIADQDPQSGSDYVVEAAEDTTSAYSLVISGLAAGDYLAAAWLRWARPDGRIAYSPSVASIETVS